MDSSRTVRHVMTPEPLTVDATATVAEAAERMRDGDVGAIVVTQGEHVTGIITDRDIAVRVVAEGHDPSSMRASEATSRDLVTLSPDDPVGDAVQVMRERAIRRVPVAQDGRPAGILPIGDLAMRLDPESALAEISSAPPQH
ncbi:MAG: CBS domain-containing protein [Gaiellales bacterium]